MGRRRRQEGAGLRRASGSMLRGTGFTTGDRSWYRLFIKVWQSQMCASDKLLWWLLRMEWREKCQVSSEGMQALAGA